MTQSSVITDEMRKAIGVESEPSIFEIEREPIRRWANAIGDPNPLYHDEEYAKKCGYRSIIAPPGFLASYDFPVKVGKSRVHFRSPFPRHLYGGSEYEFHKPVQAGDIISATTKIVDIYERDGRMGKMLFVIHETTYVNQNEELVATARRIGILYETQ